MEAEDYLNRMEQALDFIERNLASNPSFPDIASSVFISPYHFARLFRAMVGDSVADYVRKRRLASAAGELVGGKKRIIEVAQDWGYESQEAFTRAFKKQFASTPARYRTEGKNMLLYTKTKIQRPELLHMQEHISREPQIIEYREFLAVGLVGVTTLLDNKIPELWKNFMQRLPEVSRQRQPGRFYGIFLNAGTQKETDFTQESQFQELTAVEVSALENIPEGMLAHKVPACTYARFTHRGSVELLERSYNYIYGTWLPNSPHQLGEADDFERYDERFRPQDPENSELDIFIPIKA